MNCIYNLPVLMTWLISVTFCESGLNSMRKNMHSCEKQSLNGSNKYGDEIDNNSSYWRFANWSWWLYKSYVFCNFFPIMQTSPINFTTLKAIIYTCIFAILRKSLCDWLRYDMTYLNRQFSFIANTRSNIIYLCYEKSLFFR